MSEKAPSSHGRFVWYDLMTSDPKGSRAFYTELFGWGVKEVDMGPGGIYTMVNNGSEPHHGGIAALDPAHGTPNHWIGYVHVDHLDQTLAKATELGAKTLLPATPIPNVGRFAIIADPSGAAIAPMTLDKVDPEKDGQLGSGHFVWSELWSTDPDQSKKFYTTLFGWGLRDDEMGGFGTYTSWKRGERDFGGMMKAPPHLPQSAWVFYVKVDHLEESLKRAEKLGAKMLVPPTKIGEVGSFTVIQDPQGAVLAMYNR